MNLPGASFPTTRMRRNRRTDWSRRLVQENSLSVNDLIWPIFVQENGDEKTPVASMPGAFRYNVKGAVKAVEDAAKLGIPVVAVFPHVENERKDPHGNYAIAPDNHVCRTVRAIRQEGIEIGVMCDAALDPFTSHGHDGVLVDDEIANDPSVEILVKQSLIQAEAGCVFRMHFQARFWMHGSQALHLAGARHRVPLPQIPPHGEHERVGVAGGFR